MIISIEYFYWLAGVLLLITAGMILTDRTHPKRWTSGLFWALFALVFLIGDRRPVDLRLCRSRSSAAQRGRGSRDHVPRQLQYPADPCR